MPNSLACEARMPELSETISSVPPCRAETFAWSPPSTPPGKRLTFILPPLFDATSSANFSMPMTSGWPFGFCVANLNSCACAGAHASSAATIDSAANCLFIVCSSEREMSAGEPSCRHGHQLREQHHQEHHRELGPHERQHAARDVIHFHA